MRRFIVGLFVCLAMFCGTAWADEGVIVSFEMGTLTVKVGNKEEKIPVRGVKVLDADGKELAGAARRDAFKKDVKIEFTKKDDKVTEIKIKK